MKEEKISDVKNASQEKRNKQTEVKETAEKFTVVIEKSNETISDIYKNKDKLREEYFKAKMDYEIQNDRVRWIKRMAADQRSLTGKNEDKQARKEKLKQEIDNRQNPKLKEIETCDSLIVFCNKLKAQQGLVAPSNEEVAKKIESDSIKDFNKQDIDQKLKDGKIMISAPKKEEMTIIGSKGGKKGKKPKTQTMSSSEVFKIDLEVIKKFGIVGVSPPVAPEDLEPKIEELKIRLVKLNQEGEKELDYIKQELAKNIDLAVEEDIEREQKANEDEYGEEDQRPSYRGGRGGRGGRGRDRRYGDYSPEREEKKDDGGYFGQKFGVKPQKGEFEGSDDDLDDYTSSAYTKPTRGGV